MKPPLALCCPVLLAGSLIGLLLGYREAPGRTASARATTEAGLRLGVAGTQAGGGLLAARPGGSETTRLRLTPSGGKPKIAYSFNADDDLAAIRRAGFTHVLISYLQARPDEEQRRKLDECRRHGLQVIYRMVDLVDRDRRTGGDTRMRHAVELLRDHPALAGWQTYEETNLPPAQQVAVYRKIKGWDPRHPILIVTTNEYSEGWYRRTYSDDAQDILMIDFYPYKRRYDGWIFIHRTVPAILAVQKRPVPIIPIIQASSATGVPSSDDTLWPPPGGLVKQLNLWWSLGADAGVALWLWRGSPEYPFVGLADPQAPPHARIETEALLRRIPDGELPGLRAAQGSGLRAQGPGRPNPAPSTLSPAPWLEALRLRPRTVNHLKNSGFEDGLEGWVGYNRIAGLTDQARQGRLAARMENSGAPYAIGVGQRTDLLVPPNATVTLSCSYKVLRETTLLQWKIDTTAYPKFGAAEFLERRERLPAVEWRRGWVSATNTTGAPQRVTGASVSSNGFTGEVLLDNFQLEVGPAPTSYSDQPPEVRTAAIAQRRGAARNERKGPQAGDARGAAGLRYDLPAGSLGAGRARQPDRDGWTLSAWSAVETPPEPGSYACLATVSPALPSSVVSRQSLDAGGVTPRSPGTRRSSLTTHDSRLTTAVIELRFSVDAGASDANGWVGALTVTAGRDTLLELPLALAPRQPLFWALSSTAAGALTLHAAPAGFNLERATRPQRAAVSLRTPPSSAARSTRRGPIRSILLGADPDGEHRLYGSVGGGRFVPRALSEAEIERLQDRPAATGVRGQAE